MSKPATRRDPIDPTMWRRLLDHSIGWLYQRGRARRATPRCSRIVPAISEFDSQN